MLGLRWRKMRRWMDETFVESFVEEESLIPEVNEAQRTHNVVLAASATVDEILTKYGRTTACYDELLDLRNILRQGAPDDQRC